MKFIINYSPPGSTSKVYKTELTSSNPKETWGHLTQRYIEHSSLHPPLLLSLLKSLNHGSSANNNKYQLRYGDGYATNCRITWNASRGGRAAGGGEDDEMIEANITLKPLAGSPLANTSLGKVSDISMLVIANSVPTKVKSAALDISVELVGLPNPNSDIKMTQAPFPIDMEKVNVLDIVEHGRFEGVVDQYSLKKFNESGEGGGVAATPMSSGKKKRKESSAGTSAAANTTAKKASAATAATSSTKKKESKKKDKTTATTSSKKQKTVKDTTNDGKDGTAEKTPKKSSSAAAAEETTEKKKSKKKKKKKSSDVEEEDNKAGPTGTVKKSRKSSDGKGEEDEANPVAEPSPPPKSSKKEKKKKKKSKDKDNEDKDEEEATSPSKAKIPKRPVNAYMLYGNAVRQQVKDANPELKPTEVVSTLCFILCCIHLLLAYSYACYYYYHN